MFRSPINCLFSCLILLIFTSTRVFSITCYNQRTCYSDYGSSTWCCDLTETCGSFEASCESVSVLSTALIATTIIGLICFCILFLICCLRSCRRQRIHTIYTNSSGQIVAGPYQQYTDRGSVRVVHVRSVYNVGSSPPYRQYPGLYEEAPPSYESAIANLPTVHQSSTPTV